MDNSINLAPTLSIGLIQTSLDYIAAWGHMHIPKMSEIEENNAIEEIQRFISGMVRNKNDKKNKDRKTKKLVPDIILLPELSVPTGYINQLKMSANAMQSVIIAGTDYQIEKRKNRVSNQAVIIIPSMWRGKRISKNSVVKYIGKTYASPEEKEKLKSITYDFKGVPYVYIFEDDEIGKFGIAICYDLLDLDRLAMYRGQIQHLFILAYNKDVTSFNHAAEAMSRMIFCNVIICNCGFYGGSLSVSPYIETYKRKIYQHCGLKLASSQVFEIPVKALAHQQKHDLPKKQTEFKRLPPGYRQSTSLGLKEKKVHN